MTFWLGFLLGMGLGAAGVYTIAILTVWNWWVRR